MVNETMVALVGFEAKMNKARFHTEHLKILNLLSQRLRRIGLSVDIIVDELGLIKFWFIPEV